MTCATDVNKQMAKNCGRYGWLSAVAPFVWEKVQIAASGENEVATLLPEALHHVAALVEPSLLDDLRKKGA